MLLYLEHLWEVHDVSRDNKISCIVIVVTSFGKATRALWEAVAAVCSMEMC